MIPEKHFWPHVKKGDVNDCWEWQSEISAKGYGRVSRHCGTRSNAHRVSWIIHYGEIQGNLFVCHKCDNRRCVNPSHLFLGTNNDNMQDKIKKGRSFVLSCEDHPRAKLTGHDVREIRRLIKTTTTAELAAYFGISQSTVRNIVSGKTWKNLD